MARISVTVIVMVSAYLVTAGALRPPHPQHNQVLYGCCALTISWLGHGFAVPILGESHIQRCILRIIVYPKMYLLILLIIIKGISMTNVTKLTSKNILPSVLDLNQEITSHDLGHPR